MFPPKKGELATLEGFEAIGAYQRTGSEVVLRIEEPGDGWLWQWELATCQIAETETELHLSHCVGSHRPDRADGDTPQPEDMTFGH